MIDCHKVSELLSMIRLQCNNQARVTKYPHSRQYSTTWCVRINQHPKFRICSLLTGKFLIKNLSWICMRLNLNYTISLGTCFLLWVWLLIARINIIWGGEHYMRLWMRYSKCLTSIAGVLKLMNICLILLFSWSEMMATSTSNFQMPKNCSPLNPITI